jgi:hypothetical protein
MLIEHQNDMWFFNILSFSTFVQVTGENSSMAANYWENKQRMLIVATPNMDKETYYTEWAYGY